MSKASKKGKKRKNSLSRNVSKEWVKHPKKVLKIKIVCPETSVRNGSSIQKKDKKKKIFFPETSVKNYHHPLRNNPEKSAFPNVFIAIRLRSGRSAVRIPVGAILFFFKRLWGPSTLLFVVFRRPLSSAKLPGRKYDQSPSYSAGVKNDWSCTSFSPIKFHGVKWENFTLPFTFLLFIQRFLHPSPHNI